LTLAKDLKGNKKGSYRHVSSKRKSRKNEGVLLKGAGEAEVLNAIFTSAFTGEFCLQESQARKTCPWMWKTKLGNIKTKWTYVSPWNLMECTDEC